jgi:hypothetical protein
MGSVGGSCQDKNNLQEPCLSCSAAWLDDSEADEIAGHITIFDFILT